MLAKEGVELEPTERDGTLEYLVWVRRWGLPAWDGDVERFVSVAAVEPQGLPPQSQSVPPSDTRPVSQSVPQPVSRLESQPAPQPG